MILSTSLRIKSKFSTSRGKCSRLELMSRRTFKYSLKLVSCSTARSSVCCEHRRALPSAAERARVLPSGAKRVESPRTPSLDVYTAPLNATSISYSNKLRKLDPASITTRCLQYSATFTYGFVSALCAHWAHWAHWTQHRTRLCTYLKLTRRYLFTNRCVSHYIWQNSCKRALCDGGTLSKIHSESVVMVSEIYKERVTAELCHFFW